MEKNKKTFTLEEVEKLVKFTYEVGLCDGEDTFEFREYLNADDFWNKNVEQWITNEIIYQIQG